MSTDKANLDALAAINHRMVAQGQVLPSVSLPDGTQIQTGTVGALILNIKIYDRICAGEEVENAPSKAELEEMLIVPIPTLSKVGMWDILPPEDWINNSKNSEGTKFVGLKAKEMGY